MLKKEMMKILRKSGYTGTQKKLSRLLLNSKTDGLALIKEDEPIRQHWDSLTILISMLSEHGLDADEALTIMDERRRESISPKSREVT